MIKVSATYVEMGSKIPMKLAMTAISLTAMAATRSAKLKKTELVMAQAPQTVTLVVTRNCRAGKFATGKISSREINTALEIV